ncbi:hypothetical protein [Thalassoglobus sp.]|uniref:hypothetical protein n=1 Tax=Thalassoglobus sp. TaxID=2795869 RepID=UPI003AA8C046
MRRFSRILGICLVIGVVAVTIDYALVNSKNRRVAGVVNDCGGRMGSIPAWPIGTEYRISFPHPLSSAQLDRLKELNSLRGWVGVAFVECELTEDQVRESTSMLHNCHLFRVVDGEMAPLRVANTDAK